MAPRQSLDEENHLPIFLLLVVVVRNRSFFSDFQAAMLPKTWIAVLAGVTLVVAKDPYDYVRFSQVKNGSN